METSELKSTIRTGCGKGPAGRMRRKGFLPAVLYGPQAEPVLLTITIADLLSLLKKREEHVFITLKIDQNGTPLERLSVIKELQIEPVTGKPLHADFYEISMDHEFHFDIPLHFVGTPTGVEEEQGELLHLKRDLRVSCLPAKLPEFIEIDISGLHIGDSLKVQDLAIAEGITVHDYPDTALVTVVAARVSGEAEGTEEPVPVAPEVIKQKSAESED